MSKKRKKKQLVEITVSELEKLLYRLQDKSITEQDYLLLEGVVQSYSVIVNKLFENKISIKRLQKLIFGCSEQSDYLFSKTSESNKSRDRNDSEKFSKKEKRKGHGRNGVSCFLGAQHKKVFHLKLTSGNLCPLCGRGHLYKMRKPGVELRIKGSSPLHAEVYELEKLRCSACQEVFKPDLPPEAGEKKYDEAAGSMLALLKYGSGMPFYRLQNLQRDVCVPLPASTQWEILADLCEIVTPIYFELFNLAAQGEVLHMDDTNVRILELFKEIARLNPKRKGTFTSGIVSRQKNYDIVLYFSGRNHAGENLNDLLYHRGGGLAPPIQMCDALSRNYSQALITILANCLSHGRRQFVDLLHIFPEECEHVIDLLADVYHNDKITRKEKMTPKERLLFHQINSAPVMDELYQWFKTQFKDKLVEPNSSLGKAITYMQKHWKKLIQFLRIENCPLDNNLCERILKISLLNRKNAMFYKTQNGARVGDIFMSIIQTARLAKINIFDYLKKLQLHASNVLQEPEKWLPWNYQKTIAELNK